MIKTEPNGELIVRDSLALTNVNDLHARGDWLFVLENGVSNYVHSVKVDAPCQLTLKQSLLVGGANECVVDDGHFLYIVTLSGNVISAGVNELTGEVTPTGHFVSHAVGNLAGCTFDGGYVLVWGDAGIECISTTRAGEIASVNIDATLALSVWSNGDVVLVAQGRGKLSRYSFGDSRVRIPAWYHPLGFHEHVADITLSLSVEIVSVVLQEFSVRLKGEAPSDIDPYIHAESDSLTLSYDMRWDQISMAWFRTFDRVDDIKEANDHIPYELRTRVYLPRGAIVKRPRTATAWSDSAIASKARSLRR